MNGYELVRMQEYQVDKRGDTMTGDLTIKNPSGAVSKLNVHRTLNGQDIQGSFDVYDSGTGIGGKGGCALSTNNKTTNQQEACYVFAPRNLFAADVPAGVRPSLGADRFRFDKLWINDIDANGNIKIDTAGGEKQVAFYNGNTKISMLYGRSNGEIGLYDSNQRQSIMEYLTIDGGRNIRFHHNILPTAYGTNDVGNNARRWGTFYGQNVRVDGGVYAQTVEANTITQTSDIKLKENIRYIDSNKHSSKDIKEDTVTKDELFNFIKNLKVCEYNYIESDVDKIGIIANDLIGDKVGDKMLSSREEVVEILEDSEVVEEIKVRKEEFLTYDVTNMLFATIGALQEEIKKRENLEKENEELKDRLKLIEEKLGI